MTTDLPNRPKPKDEEHRIIDPRERVKSVADKTDPRFEAARARADREDQARARSEALREQQAEDKAEDGEEADDAEAAKPSDEPRSRGFSFNMTDESQDAEEQDG